MHIDDPSQYLLVASFPRLNLSFGRGAGRPGAPRSLGFRRHTEVLEIELVVILIIIVVIANGGLVLSIHVGI